MKSQKNISRLSASTVPNILTGKYRATVNCAKECMSTAEL
jgi:hypothetical protein